MVVGGGCYGTFYARQLLLARARGAARWESLLVVDRDPGCRAASALAGEAGVRVVTADWADFLDGFLADAVADDAIVPSPLMPHLMVGWLQRRAAARWPGRAVGFAPLDVASGLPYDAEAPDGTRYLSFADWTCPIHCIEPLTCPRTRAPRTWEMGEALAALSARLGRSRRVAGPALFTCRHRTHGVGTFGADEALVAEALVASAGAAGPAEVLVGTVSACHGAATLLRLG
ncbi:MAG: hypothetical protein NW201_15425 [Gemmatimonadales bacterium]|nr:hypothetical protein [Gemmatimonadales bacterium]